MGIPFITLAEVKSYLSIQSTNEDARIANLIPLACEFVETYCGRLFTSNTYTEYHTGGTSSIFVKNLPVNNVASVLEYDGYDYQYLYGPNVDGSMPNLNANANYVLGYVWFSETGEVTRNINRGQQSLSIIGPATFGNYPKGVKITYNGGYDSIPLDLKQVTMEYVKIMHKQIDNQTTWMGGEKNTGYDLPRSGFPAHIRRILDLYRIIM